MLVASGTNGPMAWGRQQRHTKANLVDGCLLAWRKCWRELNMLSLQGTVPTVSVQSPLASSSFLTSPSQSPSSDLRDRRRHDDMVGIQDPAVCTRNTHPPCTNCQHHGRTSCCKRPGYLTGDLCWIPLQRPPLAHRQSLQSPQSQAARWRPLRCCTAHPPSLESAQ